MALPTVRSTTSEFFPPPPGKVIPVSGMFRNVAILVAPGGAMTPAANAAGARLQARNYAFVNLAPIVG